MSKFQTEHAPDDHIVKLADGRETMSDLLMLPNKNGSNCGGSIYGFDCGIRR